jgi:hypothetical protein
VSVKLAIAFAFLVVAASAAVAQTTKGGSPNRLVQLVQGHAVPDGLGVNVHFSKGREHDLDLVKAMGFRLFRTDLTWSKVETQRGIYDWKAYDALVANGRQRGLIPLLILAYSNPLYTAKWMGDSGRLDWAFEPPVSDNARNAFVAFARAAAERYRGQVVWEIWNEPNLTFGKPFRLDDYIRLALESCRAMRSAYREATIVGPASAGFAMGLLESFVKSDKEGCFDAISVHPYRDWDPDSALRDWQRLDAVLAKWDQGHTKVAINSEWGYSVRGGPWTERRQAEYVLRLYMTDLLAGIPLTIIYDLRNDGEDAHDKEANFGLLDFHGKPKPVAGALTGMVRELRGMTVLGKVRTSSDEVSAVAFGAEHGLLKLVAWSLPSRQMQLTLGPTLCLASLPLAGRKCGPADATILIAPTRLEISGLPTVVEVQTEGCTAPKDNTVMIAEWCKAHQRILR